MLDSILRHNFTEQIALQCILTKKEMNNIMKQQSEFHIHRTRQRYYFHGASPTHLLAMKIRISENFSAIPTIKSMEGSISTDPKQINLTFQTFYRNLYKSKVPPNKNQCDRFLNPLHLPQLSRMDSADLDKTIMLVEVR